MKRPSLFRGMVLIGPAIVCDGKLASPVTKFAAKWLAKIVPSLPIADLNNDLICQDKEVVSFWRI